MSHHGILIHDTHIVNVKDPDEVGPPGVVFDKTCHSSDLFIPSDMVWGVRCQELHNSSGQCLFRENKKVIHGLD